MITDDGESESEWVARERSEVDSKEQRARELMDELGVDVLVLRRIGSFAWATAGASSFIHVATEAGEAVAAYLPNERRVFTNVIEAARLRDEEHLGRRGWSLDASPWLDDRSAALRAAVRGLRVASDLPQPGEVDAREDLARLRSHLESPELGRLRALGSACAEAMREAVECTERGQSGFVIAANLSSALLRRAVWPVVLQVACDSRASLYRHALPTRDVLDRYAILSFCGRAHGLVCSITRAVHFGPLPAELATRQLAVARVDAALLRASRIGATLGDVFRAGERAYQDEEAPPREWLRHHQGGLVGYEPREILLAPTSQDVLVGNQALAYNPTLEGVKSEDTVILNRDGGLEVITQIAGWPSVHSSFVPDDCARPAILVR